MKNIHKYFTLFVSSIFTAGCSFYNYIPTPIPTPMLGTIDEVHLSGGFSNSSYSGQLSYSPETNIGTMVNIIGMKNTNEQIQKLFHDEHIYGEFGGGYYCVFKNSTTYEAYVGYGRGNTSVRTSRFSKKTWITTDESRGKYSSFFILQNYGATIDTLVDVVLSLRMVSLNYSSYSTTKVTTKSRLSTLMIEPALTVKYGWPSFKFVWQLMHSRPVHDDVVFDINPFNISVGIEILFPIRK